MFFLHKRMNSLEFQFGISLNANIEMNIYFIEPEIEIGP